MIIFTYLKYYSEDSVEDKLEQDEMINRNQLVMAIIQARSEESGDDKKKNEEIQACLEGV